MPPTEAAVGVADDALEISEAVRAPRTEGDAGLRYPSRSLRADPGIFASVGDHRWDTVMFSAVPGLTQFVVYGS